MKPAGRVAGLMLLVTFTVGGLAGMAIEEATGIDWFEFLDSEREADGDATRLLTGLELSNEQRERMDDILARQEDEIEAYWKTRMPEIGAILERGYSEIRSGLNPAQQSVFDRRIRELDGRIPEEIRD